MKKNIYLLFVVFFFFNFFVYSQTGNDIWNQYILDQDRHPNIPNCSYAGYRGIECDSLLPSPNYTIYNIKNAPFNAIGNGITDDTHAFEAAIAAAESAGSGIIFIPSGTYVLTKILHIKKNNIILRGEGRELTTLNFTKSLQTIYGNFGASDWWFAGGLIWIGPSNTFDSLGKIIVPNANVQSWEYWRSPSVITNVTNTAQRGDQVIIVNSATNLSIGMKVLLTWENPADKSLVKHIYGHAGTEAGITAGSGGVGNCSSIISPIYSRFQWPVEIKDIAGNVVTLSQPLRIDIKPEWNVRFEQLGQSVQEVGIEDLRIKCHARLTHGHLQATNDSIGGWNGIYMNRVWNCWVKNVAVTSAEEGFILAAAKNVTLTNTLIDGPEQNHHSYACRVNSHDNLIENFTVDGPKRVRHGINTEWFSSGNVWSRGLQKAGTFDSHRAVSFDFIRTECTVANDAGSVPGGASTAGPFIGRRAAHWNINVYIDPSYPLLYPNSNGGAIVYQPKQYPMGAFVGVRGTTMSTAEGGSIPTGDKGTIVVDNGLIPTIVNLFKAEKNFRCKYTTDKNIFANKKFNIYPNPANNYIILEGTQQNTQFELYDVLGKKAFHLVLNSNTTRINILELNKGIYFFRIASENKIIQTGKLIKE